MSDDKHKSTEHSTLKERNAVLQRTKRLQDENDDQHKDQSLVDEFRAMTENMLKPVIETRDNEQQALIQDQQFDAETKWVRCEEERLEYCQSDEDLAAQISKWRRILAKRLEAERAIGLETLQIAEKKRIREKKQEGLENQVEPSSPDANIINGINCNDKEVKRDRDERQSNTRKTLPIDSKNIKSKKDAIINRIIEEFQIKLKLKRQEDDLKRDIENLSRNLQKVTECQGALHLKKDFSKMICLRELNEQEDKAFDRCANETVNKTVDKIQSVQPIVKVVDDFQRRNLCHSKELVYSIDELKAMRPPPK